MRYFPLVWAALTRKPTRAGLTLLSVTVAFALFGLMIGVNASLERILNLGRLDIVFVVPRFGGTLPSGMAERIKRLPNVADLGKAAFVNGYHRDPKIPAYSIMIDVAAPDVWGGLPLTPARLKRLSGMRDGLYFSRSEAERLHVRPGDTFTIISPTTTRADGRQAWSFHVLGVLNDVPTWTAGFVVGNYDYYDKSRPLADQGNPTFFQLLMRNRSRASTTAAAIDDMFANSGNPTTSTPQSVAYQSGWSSDGINVPLVTREVAGIGLFMILLLVGNGIAQSVRERIPEFAVLKTLGFSDAAVMTLVFLEAAVPCVLGAALGIGLAAALTTQIHLIIPAGWGIPMPYLSPSVVISALAFSLIVALVSAVLPVLGLIRMDIATALMRR